MKIKVQELVKLRYLKKEKKITKFLYENKLFPLINLILKFRIKGWLGGKSDLRPNKPLTYIMMTMTKYSKIKF